MAKCGGCGKFISSAESAKCCTCGAEHHRGCVNLPNTGVIPSSWRCPECTSKEVRDNKSDTPVRGRAHNITPIDGGVKRDSHNVDPLEQAQGELLSNLKQLNEELCSVRTEFRLFRTQMAELSSSIKKCTERMDSLESRVVVLEQQKLHNRDEVSAVDTIIAELRRDLNERDQQLLANDIEIGNISETSGENPTHLVSVIAVKLGMTIEERDVVSAERVGGYNMNVTSAAGAERRPRPLVVRLARRQLRDELLRSARVRRGATTEDLPVPGPPQRFYVNERLTKHNRQLFRLARDAARRCGWRFVWTRRGTVLARRGPDEPTCTIRCEADIMRHFPADH